MESSDESFAWSATASSAEESSDGISEVTMNGIHNESESDKSYKKKLHNKLFKTESESEVKSELLNGDSIKHEADSDIAVPSTPRKRKRKRERTPNLDSDHVHDNLVTQVKQEIQTVHSESYGEKSRKSKIQHIEDPENKHFQEPVHIDSLGYITKKKKSKRKKESLDDSSETIIEDKFCAEDTIVETRPERKLSTNMEVNIAEEIQGKISKKKKKRNHDSAHDLLSSSLIEITSKDINNRSDEISEIPQKDTDDGKTLENDSSMNKRLKKQGKSKLSDRIQFEDGEDLIAACNEATDINTETQSSKLKRYLKANPHLHSLPRNSSSNVVLSQHDDIWLLNFPREINIPSLQDCCLTLDNKCKIKVSSQTFVGNLKSEIDRAAILSFEHNKPVIRSLVVNGIVNFRKRIPKAHFIEDNNIANNQTDFIPLPDTKCRHPLFGSDYKKAMKIPSSVKYRLKSSFLEPLPAEKEGKKKKKRKHEETEIVDEVTDGIIGDGLEIGGETRVGRKRRRSERDPEQPARKKTKHVKQELKFADSWDSEKAIEENLFKF